MIEADTSAEVAGRERSNSCPFLIRRGKTGGAHVAAHGVVRGPAGGLRLDAPRMRAQRAEQPEGLPQLSQQVEAGVLRYPHPGLVAASKLVILANANVKCGPTCEL